MVDLIGLCGFARSGKNSFSDFIIDLRTEEKADLLKVMSTSFAYALREDLDAFLLDKLNISAFTEDEKEKEIIRPMLITWGTDVMRDKIDKNHWINKIQEEVNNNRKKQISSIITDVRFGNELEWIRKNQGITIFIERENIGPKNDDERNHTLPLRDKCDLIFKWSELDEFQTKGKKLVKEFLTDNNLCHLISQTNN